MKKIAFIYTSMCLGGVEKCLINMLNVFDYSNYDITLWLLRNEGELLGDIPIQVHVRYWNKCTPKSVIIEDAKKCEIVKLLKHLFYFFISKIFAKNYCVSNKYMTKIMPKVCTETYDYFIVYHGWDFRAMYTALKRFNAHNYALWLHCEPWLDVKYFLPYINSFNRIFCVSNSIKSQTISLFQNYYNKFNIEEFYNISDRNNIIEQSKELIEPFDEFSIVTVGRLAIEKGQEMIPEIVSNLKKFGYKVKWYLVGDGIKRKEIEDKINLFSVKSEVILLGAKYNPYPYVRQCDLYVQPSYTEGYCTTTVEAKILCKPIIVTDVPGMPGMGKFKIKCQNKLEKSSIN